MSLRQITWYSFSMMVIAVVSSTSMAALASTPTAVEIAGATSQQLLAWGLIIEGGVIVTLAGALVYAYRAQIKTVQDANTARIIALEKQIEACRSCAEKIATAMSINSK